MPEATAPLLPLQPRGFTEKLLYVPPLGLFTQQSGIYLIFAHLQRRSNVAFTPHNILERRDGRLGRGRASLTLGSEPRCEMEIKVQATTGRNKDAGSPSSDQSDKDLERNSE